MLFVRTNKIISCIIFFYIFLNSAMTSCSITLDTKEKSNFSQCTNQLSTDTDEDATAKDYCQKLNKHVGLLKEFNELNKTHKIVDFREISSAISCVKNIEYKNDAIKICITKMVEQKSLEPFFESWVYAYGMCISNKDIDFVREFSIVVFSLYENILTILLAKKIGSLKEQGVSSDQSIRSLLDDIIKVYNAISELPIKEIIMTLEKCYVLFSKILNDYGAGSGIGIKQWISKYWWLPPTIIIAIIGAILSKKVSKAVGSKFEPFLVKKFLKPLALNYQNFII